MLQGVRNFDLQFKKRNRDAKFTDMDIMIRRIQESDREVCVNIWSENSIIKGSMEDDRFSQIMWEAFAKSTTVAFLIFNPSNDEVYGICQLDYIDSSAPHIGIDILEKFRNKGYGYQAIKQLLDEAKNLCTVEYFIWRCDVRNTASQKLVEKLNGKRIATKTLLPPQVIEFGKKKGIFQTEDDISKIYEYKIEIDSLSRGDDI